MLLPQFNCKFDVKTLVTKINLD